MGTKVTKTFKGFTEKELREIAKGYSTESDLYRFNPEVFCIIYDYCPQIINEVYPKKQPITKCIALERLITLKRGVEHRINERGVADVVKGVISGQVFTNNYPKKFMDIVKSDDVMGAIQTLETELVSIDGGDDTIVDEYFGC